MKHAAVVVIAAGLAGATFLRQDQPPRQTAVAKLQIPDPGPLDDAVDRLMSNLAPDWQPTDNEVVVPDEPAPADQIAERPSRIRAVSDEQPFAVTEDADEADNPVKKSKTPPADAIESTVEAPPESKTTATEWKSVEGRPISIRRLGEGRYKTVILTGLDGRDRTAVQWADDLAEALEQQADLLQQQEFIMIRAANPDGLAIKIQKNGHGVVLNRNFPTKRYRLDAGGASGPGPASEPETRAVLQTLYDVRPQRVIHLSSTTGKSGAYYNSPGEDVAERLTRQYGLHSESLNMDMVPGSVEEFVDATWNVRLVRLNLRGVPENEAPRKVLPILLSAVTAKDHAASDSGAVAPVSTPRKEPSRWQNGPTSSPLPVSPDGRTTRRNRPVQRRGYEELPPPPQ